MRMPRSDDPNDPRGLIQEAFRMDGITPSECRSVFLDWALWAGADYRVMVTEMMTRHADAAQDHPMMVTLRAALGTPPVATRRGGRAGRVGHDPDWPA
jgi:hypothetical protein